MPGAWIKRFLMLAALAASIYLPDGDQRIPPDRAAQAEVKAVEFLTREVPAWPKDNGCFSCHNNGDAARALYAATRKGYRIPAGVLAETTAWVSQPSRWDQNKGDPGFNDKRLANIQFAASLLAAFEAGQITDRAPLEVAARKVAAEQSADGTWKIGDGKSLGAAATYGTPLATYMALKTLKQAGSTETKDAARKAEQWLRQMSPSNVMEAATLLLASIADSDQSARLKQEQCLKLIRSAQTSDGGWGPYADSPPESFDTALTLLALAQLRQQTGSHNRDGDWILDAIRRGRAFLAAEQNPNGSWPATTRPPRGDSYAQLMSTTGWATLALLETRD